MKRILYFLLVMFINLFGYGQTLKGINPNLLRKIQQEASQNSNVQSVTELSKDTILNSAFLPGVIIKTNGIKIKDNALLYNALSNTMQFVRKGAILDFLETNSINYAILGDKIFVYSPYNESKKIRLSYFELLNDGNFQLLKMHPFVFNNVNKNISVSEISQLKELKPGYYFRYKNGTANHISSKKKLIRLLQPVPQKLIDYIRKEKIRINNEHELVDLMKYANEMIN